MGGLPFDLFAANVITESKNSLSLEVLLFRYFFEVSNTVDDQWGSEVS